jgi:hypothetical protein
MARAKRRTDLTPPGDLTVFPDMKAARRHARRAVSAMLMVAGLTGCATTGDLPDGPKVVVDGNQYVTLDPPVGSHIKRHVRLIDVNEPGISPTVTATSNSELNLFPISGGIMGGPEKP